MQRGRAVRSGGETTSRTTTAAPDSIPGRVPRLRPAPDGRIVVRMGFLDKLFGRAKDTAGDAADAAAPAAEAAQDAAGRAWDEASETAGDAVDEAKDTVAELTDGGEDDDPPADPAGSGPAAA